MSAPTRAACPICGRMVRVTVAGKLFAHNRYRYMTGAPIPTPPAGPGWKPCEGSGLDAPRTSVGDS